MNTRWQLCFLIAAGLFSPLAFAQQTQQQPFPGAGVFQADFNSGQPDATRLFGDARVKDNVLQLTTTTRNQKGSFVIDPLHGGKPIKSFSATFKALVGGGSSADGFSFFLGSGFPQESFSEDGIKSGLIVVFDTFQNARELVPGVRVILDRKTLAEASVPALRSETFPDVFVKLDPDGTLDLAHNGELILTNLALNKTSLAGQFGFTARTGDQTDNHFIDDLHIISQTTSGPFIETFAPFGTNASPSATIEVVVRDFVTSLDLKSIRLEFDGESVVPEIEKQDQLTRVFYELPGLLQPGSSHAVSIGFSSPGQEAITHSYTFVVSEMVRLSE